VRGRRRERAERLAAPRSWLPRWRGRVMFPWRGRGMFPWRGRGMFPWRGRGMFRLGVVCALLLTAAAVLLLDPGDPVSDPPMAQRGRAPTTPSPCAAPAGGPPRGTVGFPLRLADPAVLAVVRAGARVDILALGDAQSGPTDTPGATVIAADLPVLRTVGTAGGGDGVLYLAVSPGQAAALAGIGAGAKVSVTVRSPG
jgi:hypothetical protein